MSKKKQQKSLVPPHGAKSPVAIPARGVTPGQAARELLRRRKEGNCSPDAATALETEQLKAIAESDDYEPRRDYVIEAHPGLYGEAIGKAVISPEYTASSLVCHAEGTSGVGAQIDLPALAEVLREQAAAVNRGDMSFAEGMLVGQAVALQSIFRKLAGRALSTDSVSQCESAMRLALKAQAQSRCTLETLSNIKNPPVFAKQANFAAGAQQVNNGPVQNNAGHPVAREEIKDRPKEVSSHEGKKWLDGGTQGEAIGCNPALEALGALHRPEDE